MMCHKNDLLFGYALSNDGEMEKRTQGSGICAEAGHKIEVWNLIHFLRLFFGYSVIVRQLFYKLKTSL